MRIKNESELLDIEKRKQLIMDIESSSNRCRKNEAYKRYQCYKDKTKTYVVENLLRQLDPATVEEMRYALANISIVRKVIDKLARVYSNGVDRSIVGEGGKTDKEATERLKQIEKKLDVNSVLKKTNRILKLERNAGIFIRPCPTHGKDGQMKWAIKPEAMVPYLYDVIEDEYDRTKAVALVLSDYAPPSNDYLNMEHRQNAGNPAFHSPSLPLVSGAKEDKSAPADPLVQKKRYIVWTKNLHFTMDETANIVEDAGNPENRNPFGIFNFLSFSIDQDGGFWADGGDDLIDGAILINSIVSHTAHVGVIQGYGQFYMTGENLPRSIKVGPTKAIIAEYKKDEQAEPKMGFLNANPQLDSLRSLVEMYLALLLTTNNLSTSGVSTQLSGAQNMASGIALILDKAESLEDTQDQRQVFIDKEPELFLAINAALKVYGNNLIEDQQNLELPEDFYKRFTQKFHDPTPIMSETEKLNNLKLRHELGIDSMISSIMKDDPNLSEGEAEARLRTIIEQRLREKLIEQELATKLGVTYEGPETENTTGEHNEDSEAEEAKGETGEEVADTSGTPTVGDTSGGQENVQQQALNGAQVTSLVDVITKVANGELPRDAAINLIVLAFNVTPEDAANVLGTAGAGFVPTKPEPIVNQGFPPKKAEGGPQGDVNT